MNKRIEILEQRVDALEKQLGTPGMAEGWFMAFLGEQTISQPTGVQRPSDLDAQRQTQGKGLGTDHKPDRTNGEQDRGLDE